MASIWLPPPMELIKNEIETLLRLRNDPLVAQYFGRLVADANNRYSYYNNQMKIPNYFSFESQIEISIGNKAGKVFLGGEVRANTKSKSYNQLTYYFAVCQENVGSRCLLKKMHFDYADPSLEYRSLHPVFHFQFPGELTPALKGEAYADHHLAPWLSRPRVPFHPMTLALLINLILIEFPDDKTQKITERTEWRHLVKNNEELVLNPYFKTCFEFIEERNKDRVPGNKYLLTNDLHYGIT